MSCSSYLLLVANSVTAQDKQPRPFVAVAATPSAASGENRDPAHALIGSIHDSRTSGVEDITSAASVLHTCNGNAASEYANELISTPEATEILDLPPVRRSRANQAWISYNCLAIHLLAQKSGLHCKVT